MDCPKLKDWRDAQKLSMGDCLMARRSCAFSFTNTKRLALLLLGAVMVTMHVSRLSDTICYLHCWHSYVCLKEDGPKPKP